MRVGESREELIARVRLLARGVGVALAALGAVYWFVQVLDGATYRELAENNRLRKIAIKAPRGTIFDRAGRVLVENAPSYNLLLDRSRSGDLDSSVRLAAAALGRAPGEIEAIVRRDGGGPLYRPLLLAEGLTLDQVARFGVVRLEHPEFEVEVSHRRLYRLGARAGHLLGYLGEATEAELDAQPGRLKSGDWIGRRGIERTFDARLRGVDGERVVVVDSHGELVQEHRRAVGQPGESLALTLDLELQETAEAMMVDKTGAVVALDPQTGEILALVSSPSYDPNLFARRLARTEWQQLLDDPRHPLQNRAIQNTYSPGSLFKIVMGAAGLAEGVVDERSTAFCNGGATFYGRRFRCWKAGGHGTVNLRSAIQHSCDVYFYALGQKLGVDTIARYARLFGMGRATGIEIEGEKNGLVPDTAWSLAARKHPWYAGETISVAIGQGPLLATPLQVAAMLAVVANGGHHVVPHLVRRERETAGERLGIDARHLAPVRDGLWAVVNDRGTGAAAAVPGFDVAGKTGTVQVVAQEKATDSDLLPYEKRDHAWFASFAPASRPRLVVVVFVEHGGKGSKAAAPVAKALYERFFDVAPPPESRPSERSTVVAALPASPVERASQTFARAAAGGQR